MTGGWRKPLQQQNKEYHLKLKVYAPSNDNVGKYTTRFCEVKNLLWEKTYWPLSFLTPLLTLCVHERVVIPRKKRIPRACDHKTYICASHLLTYS